MVWLAALPSPRVKLMLGLTEAPTAPDTSDKIRSG